MAVMTERRQTVHIRWKTEAVISCNRGRSCGGDSGQFSSRPLPIFFAARCVCMARLCSYKIVCLCILLSVTRRYCVERLNESSNCFHLRV